MTKANILNTAITLALFNVHGFN